MGGGFGAACFGLAAERFGANSDEHTVWVSRMTAATKLEKTGTLTKASEGAATAATAKLCVSGLNFYYGARQALYDVSLEIEANRITALIGPSGCGKSTFLRVLNRMHEMVRGSRVEGSVYLDGQNIFELDVTALRRRVGMVFQRANPFPKSIFENVAYGLRVNGLCSRAMLADEVEKSLRRAALWEEVKDQLHKPAYALSGGQQQRLCIARALAIDPEVLLLDEPSSALDPIATSKIEELHGGDCHAQHATGSTDRRPHGILSAGAFSRDWGDEQDFPESVAKGDGGLYYGPFRIAEGYAAFFIGTRGTAAEAAGDGRVGGVLDPRKCAHAGGAASAAGRERVEL